MNVRPSSDSRPAAAASALGAVRPDKGPPPNGAPPPNHRPPGAADSDRVELSPQARAEASQSRSGQSQSPEIESARVALRAEPGLSAERLHELKEQVRTGHFDKPEVVARVAANAFRDLGA